jgi:flavin-dependent dehydrogenase
LPSVEKAGVEVLTETVGIGAENTPEGVKVRVRGRSGEQILEARAAVAADGNNSAIVDSLGLNKDRKPLAPPMLLVGYVTEGLEDVPKNTWMDFIIPGVNPQTDIWMYMLAEGRMMVGTGPITRNLSAKMIIEKFKKLPIYAPWFRHSRVVKKTAYTTIIRTPIKVPVAGNVVIVGDASAPYETLIQGALACGCLAVKAIEKELNGQEGYREYTEWWQNAFEFNDPTFFKTTARYMFLNNLCSDEEVDYLFNLYQGQVGVPQVIITRNMELIKKGRPELYEKLKKTAVDRLGLDMSDVWGES